MKRVDLVGEKIGEWEVLEYKGNKRYLCRCSCGAQWEVDTYSLTSGNSTHCRDQSKHNKISTPKKDITGKKFGEWEVLKYVGNREYLCRCSCGTVTNVRGAHLTSGRTTKCKNHKQNLLKHQAQPTQQSQPTQPAHGSNFIDMTGTQVQDYTVKEYIGNSLWRCTCKCGMTKEFRSWDIRYRQNTATFKCRHIPLVGRTIGTLQIQSRLGDNCTCYCTNCKRTIEIDARNIINGSYKSCGCIKASSLYSKEQVINTINRLTESNGEPPYYNELAETLGIATSTLYTYLNEYDLKSKINNTYGSKYEKAIANLIISEIGREKVELHDRKQIAPLELDIYIPSLNLAIEINGTYWHSVDKKGSNYHLNKTKACEEKGIRLVHIFEHELWEEKQREKIYNYIRKLVNPTRQVVHARNCKLSYTDKIEEIHQFLEDNHLQGSCNFESGVTLRHSETNEILGAMVFGTPRFNNKQRYDFELLRLCFKCDTVVSGGAERMFKAFTDLYDKHNPNSDGDIVILSYCDLSKFTGAVYTKLGFKEENRTQPNYVWVNSIKREILSRYMTMKSKLVAKGLGKETETEVEIMTKLGYIKIEDSGNSRYVWKKSEQVNK